MSLQPKVFSFFDGAIQDHCFFGSNNQLLAITQDKDIKIYDASTQQLLQILSGHEAPITAIDVSAEGLIVSCSQDRNAIVWKPYINQQTGVLDFKKDLVLLRINRAAICCRWSPNGKKFAVGSGSKVVAICYYEEENDWWISKHIKKFIKSSVLSIDWHPNNVLIACGTANFHTYVFSTFIKSIDTRPSPSCWGVKLPFNTLCGDFVSSTGGWIHDVSFSPSGNVLGFVAHDSTITIVYPSEPNEPPISMVSVKTNYLPFKTIKFLSENELIVAGHNCFPILFTGNEENWSEQKSIDPAAKLNSKNQSGNKLLIGDEEETTTAINMFQQMDLRGKVVSKQSTKLSSTHQNTITSLKFFSKHQISTSGNDGKVVIFNI
ncbi:Arc40p [Ascoidea rubescens DSM 1968]|uniref:Actin-related protein 2/3 complex subunit n=1 Tax=Ascoidea rubescens DSM 1968 TaxID=1344418 RepID=A0A1D2VCH3_9ASCO|nr:WD40 repeat-like protein [Ascoidea rubescens DSM 1968]ODV59388.1 WD40 repeat-like protein [Ascoidea rubescens DSM 1968]